MLAKSNHAEIKQYERYIKEVDREISIMKREISTLIAQRKKFRKHMIEMEDSFLSELEENLASDPEVD